MLVDNNKDFLQSKAKSNRKVFYVVDQLKLYPVTGTQTHTHKHTNNLCEGMTLVIEAVQIGTDQTMR